MGSALAALITACGAIVAVIVTYVLNRQRLEAIHVLVNSQLMEALSTIEELRDELRAERRLGK